MTAHSCFVHCLNALDIATGSEKNNGPVVIPSSDLTGRANFLLLITYKGPACCYCQIWCRIISDSGCVYAGFSAKF